MPDNLLTIPEVALNNVNYAFLRMNMDRVKQVT